MSKADEAHAALQAERERVACYKTNMKLLGETQRERDKLRVELSKSQEQANAMAHVIVEAGICHTDLDACGCEDCELVRKGMLDAGYLQPKKSAARGTE